jgi:multiple antibiotic resistance protein
MSLTVTAFLLALIPIFVAMDALGTLPIYLSLTDGMNYFERKKVVRDSIITGFLVTISFLALGKVVFAVIGVTISDFKVAGGVILLVIAVHDLLFPEKKRRHPGDRVGIVPLGMPLIAGPAVLTTIIICVDAYGYLPTIASLVLNLAFAWVVFDRATVTIRLLGDGGAKAIAKVASLFLAAIAVMMIRQGVAAMLHAGG